MQKFGRLGPNLDMGPLQNARQAQLPGLHKDKHYFVAILTVYSAIYVAENQFV